MQEGGNMHKVATSAWRRHRPEIIDEAVKY